AILLANSKNCVAWTIEKGITDSAISFSCTSFARKYPRIVFSPSDGLLWARRPVPTTESATWCCTPAACSYRRRLPVAVVKKSRAAFSSKDGEFDTSTTTEAPFSASASPSPVSVLTPELGDAASAACPCLQSFLTSFDPMRPLPPITTIFIIAPSIERRFLMCRSYLLRPNGPPFCDAMLRPLLVSARQTERRV